MRRRIFDRNEFDRKSNGAPTGSSFDRARREAENRRAEINPCARGTRNDRLRGIRKSGSRPALRTRGLFEGGHRRLKSGTRGQWVMRGEGRPSVNEAKEGEGVEKTHALDIERPGFLGKSRKNSRSSQDWPPWSYFIFLTFGWYEFDNDEFVVDPYNRGMRDLGESFVEQSWE